MSRRKQQNPKSLKYGETSGGAELSKPADPAVDAGLVGGGSGEPRPLHSNASPVPSSLEQAQPIEEIITVKDEPASPQQTVNPASPVECGAAADAHLLSQQPSETGLEMLLGVPDDAPLKVERCLDGGYKILSAKYITKGAGLDPLRAQKLESPEGLQLIKDNAQVVSFVRSDDKVYFRLESSINCGWLKYLGVPNESKTANLSIYYVGGKLWVEVIKSLAEGEQLIAEFSEPSKQLRETLSNPEGGRPNLSSPASPSPKLLTETPAAKPQFPCTLCGIQFRNPNTLMAHKKHYCSKLNPAATTSSADQGRRSSQSSGDGEGKEATTAAMTADNLQQTAYMCLLCKFMTLTKTDMKSHVKEKHNLKLEPDSSGSSGAISGSDKTYCDDCEIHFKKAESYQAHKLHYCKSRTASNTQSPRSDNGAGGSQSISSQSPSPVSPSAKEIYKKVSVFDNQTLSASLASQAAAAMAAASLPFTLSSMLSIPGMAALPMMFQSPALIAQAMQSVTKASAAAANSADSGQSHKEETPLDLTVKQELLTNSAVKRKAGSEHNVSPPIKTNKLTSKFSSSTPTLAVLPRPALNGQVKPLKPERTIYRCESCSIPFYKKDVYEAHKLHYCSRRPSSGSEKEEEMTTPSRLPSNPEQHSSQASPPPDDRLVITYTCNKCSTSYRTIETFKAHQCEVPQPSPPLLRCEDCNFSTQSSKILAEHVDTHQKFNVTYKCTLCGYHGNTLRGMRQHGRQHMLKGEEFNDNDVETIELPLPSQRVSLLALVPPVPYSNEVDEELLRLKNEPYKKRRSRKHYQKSEYLTPLQVSPQQRKENRQHRAESSSPHSASTISCTSPLQTTAINVLTDKSPSSSPNAAVIKSEPANIIIDPNVSRPAVKRSPGVCTSSPPNKSATPAKPYVCSCNASFVAVSTFEAHKKLYCPHHKAQRNNPTITVNH